MTLENKLGIPDPAELARAEEEMTKRKAAALFQEGVLDTFEVGTFRGLSQIHRYLFEDLYLLPDRSGRSIWPRAASGLPPRSIWSRP